MPINDEIKFNIKLKHSPVLVLPQFPSFFVFSISRFFFFCWAESPQLFHNGLHTSFEMYTKHQFFHKITAAGSTNSTVKVRLIGKETKLKKVNGVIFL